MNKFLIILVTLLPYYVGAQELPKVYAVDDQIIKHTAYTLSYNETCEQPNWVKYQVKKADLEKSVAKRRDNFQEDPSVPTQSATPQDYYKSGYDKGHLAPAATFVDNQQEMDESFYMSNMSPQVPSFNRGIWKKLEEYERDMAKERDSVYVITGAILHGKLPTIGTNKVCIPEFYYKIIYTTDWCVGYLLKNEKSSEPLYTFKQPIDIIEKETNIKFNIK